MSSGTIDDPHIWYGGSTPYSTTPLGGAWPAPGATIWFVMKPIGQRFGGGTSAGTAYIHGTIKAYESQGANFQANADLRLYRRKVGVTMPGSVDDLVEVSATVPTNQPSLNPIGFNDTLPQPYYWIAMTASGPDQNFWSFGCDDYGLNITMPLSDAETGFATGGSGGGGTGGGSTGGDGNPTTPVKDPLGRPAPQTPAKTAINTDIPTLENFFTKDVPAHKSFRTRNDGPFSTNRRYAPDDAPGTVMVLAMTRLPKGFGKYADGLAMIYTTEVMGREWDGFQDYISDQGDVPTRSGPVIGGVSHPYRQGATWLARKYDSVIRVAVHKPTATPSGYASGWKVLPWRLETGLAPDGIPPVNQFWTYVHYSLGRYAPNLRPAIEQAGEVRSWNVRAHFCAQRLGDHVYFKAGGFHKLNRDLTVTTSATTGFFNASGEMFISEGADPMIWMETGSRTAVAQCAAKDIMAGRVTAAMSSSHGRILPLMGTNADPAQYVENNNATGYANQIIGKPEVNNEVPFLPMHRFVNPFSSGDYGPPEVWFLWPESNGTHTIYRSTWKQKEWQRQYFRFEGVKHYLDLVSDTGVLQYRDVAYANGKKKYPRANAKGWAFEANWRQPANIVGRIGQLPGYEVEQDYGASQRTNIEWRIFRNENDQTLVMMIMNLHRIIIRQGDDGGGPIENMSIGTPVGNYDGVDNPASIPSIFDGPSYNPFIDGGTYKGPPGASSHPINYGEPDVQYSGGGAYVGGNGWRYLKGIPDPRPSQIWTCVSYDDGKTWTTPEKVKNELRPRSGNWATQWMCWPSADFESYESSRIMQAAAFAADGSLLLGCTETYIYGRKGGATQPPPPTQNPNDPASIDYRDAMGTPTGGRVPFFKGPKDAGTRASVYVVKYFGAFGTGEATLDGVTFKKPRVAR